VTFGGNGFELPLLRYRAFALGVRVPGLHGGGHRNCWHRFGQDHVDLCDPLASRTSSPVVTRWLALPKVSKK
jgi:3'-5' exonuclease